MRLQLVPSALVLFALSGCGGSPSSFYGVTSGGVQDMTHTRELIALGMIPASGDYTVEGLFSEHSLPLAGDVCADTLCPRAATARIDPVDGADSRLLLQLGFATDINEQNFERPSLRLAVAIDISGSMDGGKLHTSKAALLEVVDQLDIRDQMALVTYGSQAKVVQQLTIMDPAGQDQMRREIEALKSKGSTAMEAGLVKAIEQLDGVPGKGSRDDRVFVLTDAQPNVGATGAGSFVSHLRQAADQEIGVTLWGVGLDLGSELVTEMSKVRGGNAFHFSDMKTMKKRVRNEFDFMVTPLAYDLEIHAVANGELQIEDTWGAPMDGDEVNFGASSLFLSARDGGMGVTLVGSDGGGIVAGQEPATMADLEVSWMPVGGDTRAVQVVDVTYEGGTAYSDDHIQADDLGVFKMGALIDEILALDAGAAFCLGDLDAATAESRILEASDRLLSRSIQLGDDGFEIESELMAMLLVNVQGGMDHCVEVADTPL